VALPVALPASATANASTPPRALPVDPSTLTASAQIPKTTQAPVSVAVPAPAPAPIPAAADVPAAPTPPRALPVNPADLNNTPAPADIPATPTPPRALPVNPADLAASSPPPADIPKPVVPASQTPSNPVPSNANGPVVLPANGSPPPEPVVADDGDKPLVLTASRDSFVRVTALDPAGGDKPVYAAVLHSGQSIGFNGHKFSVNVDDPSAVDIKLDGVNYGPHSDGSEPETFTVVSHVQ
jgi:hypothetical protein